MLPQHCVISSSLAKVGNIPVLANYLVCDHVKHGYPQLLYDYLSVNDVSLGGFCPYSISTFYTRIQLVPNFYWLWEAAYGRNL